MKSWMKKANKGFAKTIATLLAAMMAATCIAGCSVEIETVPEDSSSAVETSAPEQKPSQNKPQVAHNGSETAFSLDSIPEFSGEPFEVVNGNLPYFTNDEITDVSFESYSELDELGRCGVAFASVGRDLMPTQKRGDISKVKPTGWKVAKYDHVDGKYLYNRCHLLGHQLTGEDANERNLITGTRYMNVDGMLPFENMIADYVKETNNHVMYRVTPVYKGDEPVARGVLMEAYSVEDDGEGVLFNVFCYNNQPYVEIDYSTGESHETSDAPSSSDKKEPAKVTYVINKNTMKFHKPDCSSIMKTKEENKENFSGTRKELIEKGYAPCGSCKP